MGREEYIQSEAVDIGATLQGGAIEGEALRLWLRISREGLGPEIFNIYQAEVGEEVSSIDVAPDGSMWFATHNTVSVHHPDDSWTHYGPGDGIHSDQVRAFAFDADGTTWIAGDGGLDRINSEGEWTYFGWNGALWWPDVLDVAIEADGRLWVATEGGLAVKAPGSDSFTPFELDSEIGNPWVYRVKIAPDGSRWFSTEEGAARYTQAGVWEDFYAHPAYLEGAGLADVAPNDIAFDTDGSVWFPTLNGLTHLWPDEPRFETHTSQQGLADTACRAVAVDQGGDLWVATWGGLNRLPAGAPIWFTYTSDDGLGGDEVASIAVDLQGKRWFGTYDGGVTSLSADNQTWQVWSASDAGLSDNRINDLSFASGALWVGTAYGASRLAADGESWQTLTVHDGLPTAEVLAVAEDPAGHAWLGTIAGLVEVRPDGSISVHTQENSGLPSTVVNAIAIGPVGERIFATDEGLAELSSDGNTWRTFDEADGLSHRRIHAVDVAANGDRWLGTGHGVNRVSADGEEVQAFVIWLDDSLLPIYGVAFDESTGDVWATADSSVLRMDEDGETWDVYEPFYEDLRWYGGFNDLSLAADGSVWVAGGYAGLMLLSPSQEGQLPHPDSRCTQSYCSGDFWYQSGDWTPFTPEEHGLAGWSSRTVDLDDTGRAWVGTEAGISVVKTGAGGQFEEIIERFVPRLNIGESLEREVLAGPYPPGRYEVEGRLYSALDQRLTTADGGSFYVVDEDQILRLSLDSNQAAYRPGDPVTLNASATNRLGVPLEDIPLKVSTDLGMIHEESVNLQAAEAHTFELNLSADETFTARFDAADLQTVRTITVVDPEDHLFADISGPETVGLDAFDVSIDLYSDDILPQALTVTPVNPEGEATALTLGAGEHRILTFSVNIEEHSDVRFDMGGDVQRSLILPVNFGAGAEVRVPADSRYPEGSVLIPVEIEGIGSLRTEIGVTWTLEELDPNRPEAVPEIVDELHLSYAVPSGGTLDDLLAFHLPVGAYRLSWAHDLGEGEVEFGVVPLRSVTLSVAAGDFNPTEQRVPVEVELSNGGYLSFAGTTHLSAAFDAASQGVVLDPGEDTTLLFNLDVSGAGAGPHPFAARAEEAGVILAEDQGWLTLPGALLALTDHPADGLSYNVGEVVRLSFTVTNEGAVGAMARLAAKTLDVLDATGEAWLEPGQALSFPFVFAIPDDLPGGGYELSWNLGDQGGTIPFTVLGPRIEAAGALDAQVYRAGDTATLTLDVSHLSGSTLSLWARAHQQGIFDERQSFELTPGSSTQLTFSIPVEAPSDKKLSYGIYLEDGRNLYLDASWIHVASEELLLYTDRQDYEAGDTVTVTVEAETDGDLNISAPGHSGTYPVSNGGASFAFQLPTPMVWGSYNISWTFGDQSSSYPFDVRGSLLTVRGGGVNEGVYAPSDPITLALDVEANHPMNTFYQVWLIDPQGDARQIMQGSVAFEEGLQRFTAHGLADSDSLGTHELRFAFYLDETGERLETGARYLDLSDGIFYVDALGVAEAPDGSRDRPFRRLGQAVAVAADGDAVRIAGGRYAEELTIRRGLRLEGGYDPSTWTRALSAHPTVLVGEGDKAVVWVTQANAVKLSGLTLQGGSEGLSVDDSEVEVEALLSRGHQGPAIRCGARGALHLKSVAAATSEVGLAVEGACQITGQSLTVASNQNEGISVSGEAASLTLVGSIVANNGGAGIAIHGDAPPPAVSRSAFSNNGGGNATGMADPLGEAGNQALDCALYAPADPHLTPGSACINALNAADLDSATDIDGEARPAGGGPLPFDLGADEYVDLDGDDLPDAWEQAFFADLDQSQGDDYDGDGLTEQEEYEGHTDPTDGLPETPTYEATPATTVAPPTTTVTQPTPTGSASPHSSTATTPPGVTSTSTNTPSITASISPTASPSAALTPTMTATLTATQTATQATTQLPTLAPTPAPASPSNPLPTETLLPNEEGSPTATPDQTDCSCASSPGSRGASEAWLLIGMALWLRRRKGGRGAE